jgi:hypothetical protein
MNLRTITTRFAVAGVSTAVAASALVAAGTAAADAQTADGSYVCQLPTGPMTFPLHIDAFIPPTPTAGWTVPANTLPYTATVGVPSDAVPLLGSLHVDGGTLTNFAMSVGHTVINAPGTLGAPTAQDDGSIAMVGTGANQQFTLPVAGKYVTKLPSAFTFTPTVGGAPLDLGSGPVTLSCATDAPATLAHVELAKSESVVSGKAKKTVKGYTLRSVVAPKTQPPLGTLKTPTGKVVAKLGTKSWTASLKKGVAVFKLPKSAKGKKVSLNYKGDGYTAPSKGTVKVK